MEIFITIIYFSIGITFFTVGMTWFKPKHSYGGAELLVIPLWILIFPLIISELIGTWLEERKYCENNSSVCELDEDSFHMHPYGDLKHYLRCKKCPKLKELSNSEASELHEKNYNRKVTKREF